MDDQTEVSATKSPLRTRPFNAANLAVIEARRDVLKQVLKEHGLNVTQFRLLLLVLGSGDGYRSVQDLAADAGLPLNVVTLATNALVELGLVSKSVGGGDGRVKAVCATPKGSLTVETLHMALVYFLRRRFNLSNDAERAQLLTNGIYAGAHVGGLWTEELVNRYPSATNLVTVDYIARELEEALKREADASYNEARLVQRLSEVGHPVRAGDLAKQLWLPPTTITRAAQRLESKGRLERMASPLNAQAVFLWPSEAGKGHQKTVLDVIADTGWRIYWSKVTDPVYLKSIEGIEALFRSEMDQREAEQFEANRELLSTLTYE